ncbi:MAG: AbrB family transcriptional regulator [Alphaproteobacteria bacterium]|nr:AbrB family transcriptional regulator [Alphaproteobacteria bacterium]MDP6563905.1 AbrB family transcriptional regulator [Alphaproteobacteria bacterium]MDP6812391.1 AbrB family transcriptional regulator [Alphaproteobacteria bacterium]
MTEQPVRIVRGVLLSLIIGGVGGAVFHALNLPLPWMLGSMCFVVVAAIAGAPVALYMPLRMLMVAVLGTLLGSVFTPQILDRLGDWAGGASLMAIFVGVMSVVSVGFLIRVGGLDRITAYFAGTPGGLGEMTVVGEQQGGDPRIIPLVHATRVFIVVFLLPLYLVTVESLDIPQTSVTLDRQVSAEGVDLLILGACALIGFTLARLLRLPGGQILGPLLISAAAYLTGLVHGKPPVTLISVAQVVIGAAIGARFVGLDVRRMARPILLALISVFAMLAMAAAFAALAAPILGIPRHALLLALAPGGLAEMSLIALSLNIDTAFITTMHLVRILLIVTLAPIIFRLLGWHLAKGKESTERRRS